MDAEIIILESIARLLCDIGLMYDSYLKIRGEATRNDTTYHLCVVSNDIYAELDRQKAAKEQKNVA